MADYTCPVCHQAHPSPTEVCGCGAVAPEADASIFALVVEDAGGDTSEPIGLSLEECRRILNHMLNHGSIEKTESDDTSNYMMFDSLRAKDYPLFERVRRKDGMAPDRHRLREYCMPEVEAGGAVLEIALTPMEYLLFRQLITAGRT